MQEVVREQDLSMDAFRRQIESKGIKFNDYRDLVKTEMTVQQLQSRDVAQDVTVAKHEIESFMPLALRIGPIMSPTCMLGA